MWKNSTAEDKVDIHKARILIVDDEPRLLQSLKALMEANQYQVDTALGGKNACLRLIKQSYDLVLLDLRMADLSGHEVMRFMMENDIRTAAVVISGEFSFSAVTEALRLGAYDYLKKPYAPEELIATVDKVLRKKLLEKQNDSMQIRLQKSEELHRYIVNSSPDIVFILDRQGRFSFLNSKVETLLGYPKEQLLGQPCWQLVDPQDMERARYIFGERPTNKQSPRSMELRLKAYGESGARRHFEITVFPIESSEQGIRVISADNPSTLSNRRFIGTYGTARDISERKEAEEFINFQAYHDLLTRLPNRSLFKDRLSLALALAKRNNHSLAVMFLDLDRVKVVNDTLGHAMGDRLLQTVAHRLESCLRQGDTLSRFGGDEFTLLLPGPSSKEDARIVAKKVLQTLKAPIMLGEHEVFVGASIGIAMYPEAGETLEQLIQNADIAMYHVKERGKDSYQFYSDSMNLCSSNRLQMERDLRRALEKEEFELHYQPQVCARSGRIVGVEALIRWRHPERGLVSPAEFIPLAEETRLIDHLSDWVLRTACREVRQWIKAGHPFIRLAVNFSPSLVEHPRFVSQILNTLRECDFPPENLEIELTENVIMADLEVINQKLNKLSEQGVSIAIDDFGTGYSSLAYLQKLPIHTLKIDRSFVNDIKHQEDDACIVNAIISMAKGLRMNIIAEGVETAAQMEYLQALGCHEVQGYYFSPAIPAGEAYRLLNDYLENEALAQ